MTEVTEKVETLDEFNPEKIQFADIEEAKKKYFEVHKDLKKKGEKHAQEKQELLDKLSEMENKLNEFDTKTKAELVKEKEKQIEEAKAKGEFEILYKKESETRAEYEKRVADMEKLLKTYEEKEKELKKEELRKKKELLELIEDEETRETFKDASIQIIQKYLDTINNRNPINSKIQIPVSPEIPQELMKSEVMRITPSIEIARRQAKLLYKD